MHSCRMHTIIKEKDSSLNPMIAIHKVEWKSTRIKVTRSVGLQWAKSIYFDSLQCEISFETQPILAVLL